MQPITTTLDKIREHRPCADGWEKLLSHLGKTKADDEPLALETILDSNGLNDALWCVRACPEHNRLWRLLAVWFVRQVDHLMTDTRSVDSLDTAERYANGQATPKELSAARDAAWAARAAYAAARDAAWAAYAAAYADAYAAAYAATEAAAYAAAGDAADAAAWAAAYAAAWAAQIEKTRAVFRGEETFPDGLRANPEQELPI